MIARGQAFRLGARLVLREVPVSFGRFAVLIACIALGVGAIVAVLMLARALNEGLAREGRVVLGADAAFTLVQREANEAELAAIRAQGPLSRVIFSRAMARGENGESTVVEAKAVEADYPQAGRIEIEDKAGRRLGAPGLLLAQDQDRHGLLVDPLLLGRLDIDIGAELAIGDAKFRITGRILSEPDKLSGGLGFGPRVLMSAEAMRATGLIQPGALTRFVYRLDLDGASDAVLDSALKAIERAAPDAGWQVNTRLRASPQLQRQIGRFTQFLTLVGLTALLIGGVGVANGTRAFAERQIQRIATLKSLGATRGFVFFSSLAQVMAFALPGIAIGLALGTVLPLLASRAVGDLLPVPLVIGLYPRELLLGLAFGLATTLTFGLFPLLKARHTPASTLFRDATGAAGRLNLLDLGILAIAVLTFAALAVSTASDRRIALLYVVSAAVAIVILRLVALLIMRIARALPHLRNPILRVAFANLHRPGSLTPTVIMTLGLGLTLLVALALIDINLTRQFRASLPGIAPTFFFIDIPSREAERFDSFLKEQVRGATIDRMPQLRGRIIALKDVPAQTYPAAERVSWVLEGDRGITFARDLPQGSVVAAGEWWPADYKGPPLVSFAKDVAEGLKLAVGDTVTVNVLGRRITARIANLREVRWQQLGINFVMVFSPNTFAGAPHTYLATLAMPAGAAPETERSLTRKVAVEFPAISAVRVKDVLQAVDGVVKQLSLAIRVSSIVALIASVLVLGGALASSARTRQKEAVILKTLGGTRRTLLKVMLAEYASLGAIAVLFGIAGGISGAWLVVGGVMNLEFVVPALPVVSIALLAFIVTIILGLAGTWHILGRKPAPYLRHA